MVELKGMQVLITGASSGIGMACARAFARQGARLTLAARRERRLREVAQELREKEGSEVLSIPLDVRRREDVEAALGCLPDGWNEPDVLVNNAGLARGLAPLQQGDVDDWEEMIDTNVKGLLYVTRAVVEGMVGRGRGHVINIGSIAGHEVYSGGNVYCASKFAVTALNRAMGIDLLGTGVRVSSVDPGLVQTEFSTVRFHGDDQRASAVYQGLQPLRPEDVAEAVVWCATRPAHVNVREMVLFPSAQASAVNVWRGPKP